MASAGLVCQLTDGSGHSDLHSHLWCGDDGVVGVGHEARILTPSKRFTRSGESGLSGSVVGAHECEKDGISNGSCNAVGRVDKTRSSTNSDLSKLAKGFLYELLSETLPYGLLLLLFQLPVRCSQS